MVDNEVKHVNEMKAAQLLRAPVQSEQNFAGIPDGRGAIAILAY